MGEPLSCLFRHTEPAKNWLGTLPRPPARCLAPGNLAPISPAVAQQPASTATPPSNHMNCQGLPSHRLLLGVLEWESPGLNAFSFDISECDVYTVSHGRRQEPVTFSTRLRVLKV